MFSFCVHSTRILADTCGSTSGLLVSIRCQSRYDDTSEEETYFFHCSSLWLEKLNEFLELSRGNDSSLSQLDYHSHILFGRTCWIFNRLKELFKVWEFLIIRVNTIWHHLLVASHLDVTFVGRLISVSKHTVIDEDC